MKEEVTRQSANPARNPSMAGILAGECKGKWWTTSSLAVTYSYPVGGCGVMGAISPSKKKEIRRFFEEEVFKDLRKQGLLEFEFSAEEDELRNQMLHLFSDKTMYSEEEYSYRISNQIKIEAPISAGYQIKQVDADFLKMLEESTVQNSEMLLQRIRESWNSTAEFLERSTAYVALSEVGIVGVIIGSARYLNYIPVDIEVSREHRKQGLATALTKAFVNQCIKKGLVVQWDHVASNTASKCLANTCGFRLFKVRPYHWFAITE